MTQKKPKKEQLASHANYAATDFEPVITADEASDFGGEILANHCISFRTAVVILSKSKKELLNNLDRTDQEAVRNFSETFLTTLEHLQDTEKFIKVLAENNEIAITRILCLLSSVIPASQNEKAA
jgi:hypothetical protein